ncbi:FAD-dependent oxidoreductase [Methylogaea oryzae]|uniref:Amino oxidase n=1 Tax=Methylogaea oryzae TaxID=1295382 RepID=A0A8D4VPY5_9GAMM|nr:FAD-dependent oxidoreductase [Methylogaea oryzae]BBL71102.1 amino oxidase [Methylogaea oryzae]
MNRREFLAAGLSLPWLAGCRGGSGTGEIPGGFVDPDHSLGHRLRDGALLSTPPGEIIKIPALIAGGGIAGLSAAWWLQRHGFDDFTLLEMESHVGGNAHWGQSSVSAYPWGAHYLPLPTRESRVIRELLSDLGVIEGDPHAERPRYQERYLCNVPQERLYRNGLWQEGLAPSRGMSRRDRDQHRRFEEWMAAFRARRGLHGQKAFAIPMESSARDADLLALDRLSLRDWLLQQGLDAPTLHWYANYACRDDYGCDYNRVSAWAGIHYFASRDGVGEHADLGTVLTWPEGNGWLVRQLQTRLANRLRTGAAVFRMERQGERVAVDVWLAEQERSVRYLADHVIWAAPLFLLPGVLANCPAGVRQAIAGMEYSPWVVANLVLKAFPEEKHGVPLSWDNVLYDSPSLGYVVATHQQWRMQGEGSVFTWYHALSTGSPQQARRELMASDWRYWRNFVLADLGNVYGDLTSRAAALYVRRYGHAMARPLVGAVWGEARGMLAAQPLGRIRLAHADLSGFSIFEEACDRGAAAANGVLSAM